MFDKSGSNKGKRDRSRSPVNRSFGGANFSSYFGRNEPVPPGPIGPQGPGLGGPSNESPEYNDLEIIVVENEQRAYSEMIESRLRAQTTLPSIDMLILHNPASLTLTLNDLFERRTLYAVVIFRVNEQHNSLILHILHNQTEHRNIPIEDAIDLINKDYSSFSAAHGLPPPVLRTSNSSYPNGPTAANKNDKYRENVASSYSANSNTRPDVSGIQQSSIPHSYPNDSATANSGNYRQEIRSYSGDSRSDLSRLSGEITYLLRAVLQDGGAHLLTVQQIDSLIDYFSAEKESLLKRTNQISRPLGSSLIKSDLSAQPEAFLENFPQVKAALSSLLQLSAAGAAQGQINNTSNFVGSAYGSTEANNAHLATGSPFGRDVMSQSRRHPLMGTELGSASGQYRNFGGRRY